jgi:hypothetical protein
VDFRGEIISELGTFGKTERKTSVFIEKRKVLPAIETSL